jgi:hypothetical protein
MAALYEFRFFFTSLEMRQLPDFPDFLALDWFGGAAKYVARFFRAKGAG